MSRSSSPSTSTIPAPPSISTSTIWGRVRERRGLVAGPSEYPSIPHLARRALGEFVGTALLLIAVIGSGIAAERLSPGDIGLQLFENAVATAVALMAIILAVGPVSGAHLNPAVTLANRIFKGVTTTEAGIYVAAQLTGATFGAVVANLMFSLPAVEFSDKVRSSAGVWLGEVVATFGLLLVILALVRSGRTSATPFAVGAYIGGAYFFTSSTSVANPAATAGRTLTDTFAGIAPSSAPAFVVAQLVGALLGVLAVTALYPTIRSGSEPADSPRMRERESQRPS